jgi:hypothetical protein
LLQHPAQIAAAEDVYVKMRHLLVRGRPVIGDDAKAAFGDASPASDAPQSADQGGEFGLGAVSGEIVERYLLCVT